MGLEDYTWKIYEAALHGEFGLVSPCILVNRLCIGLEVRVYLVHGLVHAHIRKSPGL